MGGNGRTFIFVVSGPRKQIDTLNVSLRYLRHFSRHPICVVTDLRRNACPIDHDTILDVRTPTELDDHQAAIFLKTGLHRYLDPRGEYCYLDADVIAVSPNADRIFDRRKGVVTFASDHCTLSAFSPHAVSCGCLERSERLRALMDAQEPYIPTAPELLQRLRKLETLVSTFERNKAKRVWKVLPHAVQDALGRPYYAFDTFFRTRGGYRWEKADEQWLDADGNVLLDDRKFKQFVRRIEERGEFKLDPGSSAWLTADGRPAMPPQCGHLVHAIRERFDLHIADEDWRHWNGGVFLFGAESGAFLETWRELTLHTFSDPYFRTRDQGTLAATAWKLGLQELERLPREFNFIVHSSFEGVDYHPRKGFTADNFETIIEPVFIHCLREVGKTGWRVWDAVARLRV